MINAAQKIRKEIKRRKFLPTDDVDYLRRQEDHKKQENQEYSETGTDTSFWTTQQLYSFSAMDLPIAVRAHMMDFLCEKDIALLDTACCGYKDRRCFLESLELIRNTSKVSITSYDFNDQEKGRGGWQTQYFRQMAWRMRRNYQGCPVHIIHTKRRGKKGRAKINACTNADYAIAYATITDLLQKFGFNTSDCKRLGIKFPF